MLEILEQLHINATANKKCYRHVTNSNRVYILTFRIPIYKLLQFYFVEIARARLLKNVKSET